MMRGFAISTQKFLPTPSARRATRVLPEIVPGSRFLPTPSARRATGRKVIFNCYGYISTHALREEGDRRFGVLLPRFQISTHALREEGDVYTDLDEALATRFLPTPSARRATCAPLFPRRFPQISTHALREEGDSWARQSASAPSPFLPTPSARRATIPATG